MVQRYEKYIFLEKALSDENYIENNIYMFCYKKAIEDKKDKEIVRFYVTDDNRHVPIRLDMFLRFGSAKAFLK